MKLSKNNDFFKIDVTQLSMTAALSINLSIGTTFRTIKDVAKHLGVIVPPRKGFGYWGANSNLALWFPNMNQNPNWNNTYSNNFDYIYEQKLPQESASDMQKRVNKGNAYNVNLARIVFAKNQNNQYVFVGCYKLSSIDFENRVVAFKRISSRFSHTIVVRKYRVNIEVNEISSVVNL